MTIEELRAFLKFADDKFDVQLSTEGEDEDQDGNWHSVCYKADHRLDEIWEAYLCKHA